jgi:predicted DCC family thiol-disulfide oxidoreductase YuxK
MTTVLYDGYCVICQQTRRIVTALDWLKRVQFQDIHEWSAVEQRYPQLDWETAMGQVHVDTGDGKLVGGFEGARRLMRDRPIPSGCCSIFRA